MYPAGVRVTLTLVARFGPLLLLCGCTWISDKAIQRKLGGAEYTLTVTPILPLSQSPFVADTLRVTRVEADGGLSAMDLGAPQDPMVALGEDLGALIDTSLVFEWLDGGTVVGRGRTEPLTISEGDVALTVLAGTPDAVGWLGSLTEAVANPNVIPVGDGVFHVFGGVGYGSGQWVRSVEEVQLVALVEPDGAFTTSVIGTLPEWEDEMGESQDGLYGSIVAPIRVGVDAGRIFVGGGGARPAVQDPTSVTFKAWLYDPATVAFEPLADRDSLATARAEAAVVIDVLGGIVIWGGFTQHSSSNEVAPNGSVEVWDPNTRSASEIGTWDVEEVASFDAAGASLGAIGTLFCGGGLLVRGTEWAEWTTSDSCHVVSVGYSMEEVSPLPTPLAGHAMVTLADGRVFVTGGATQTTPVIFDFTETSPAQDEGWLYDPVTQQWDWAYRMTVARAGHRMVLLPDGRVLIAGGASTYAPGLLVGEGISCVEIFDPADSTYTPLGLCDADSDAGSLAGRAVLPGIALDPDFGALVVGGAINGSSAQDAVNVVFPGGALPLVP